MKGETMKKRNKYFSILLIIIIVVAFSSFGLYEIQTEPQISAQLERNKDVKYCIIGLTHMLKT